MKDAAAAVLTAGVGPPFSVLAVAAAAEVDDVGGVGQCAAWYAFCMVQQYDVQYSMSSTKWPDHTHRQWVSDTSGFRMGPSLVMRNWSTERVPEGPPA